MFGRRNRLQVRFRFGFSLVLGQVRLRVSLVLGQVYVSLFYRKNDEAAGLFANSSPQAANDVTRLRTVGIADQSKGPIRSSRYREPNNRGIPAGESCPLVVNRISTQHEQVESGVIIGRVPKSMKVSQLSRCVIPSFVSSSRL